MGGRKIYVRPGLHGDFHACFYRKRSGNQAGGRGHGVVDIWFFEIAVREKQVYSTIHNIAWYLITKGPLQSDMQGAGIEAACGVIPQS